MVYVILCKGLERSQILEFLGGPGTKFLQIQREDYIW